VLWETGSRRWFLPVLSIIRTTRFRRHVWPLSCWEYGVAVRWAWLRHSALRKPYQWPSPTAETRMRMRRRKRWRSTEMGACEAGETDPQAALPCMPRRHGRVFGGKVGRFSASPVSPTSSPDRSGSSVSKVPQWQTTKGVKTPRVRKTGRRVIPGSGCRRWGHEPALLCLETAPSALPV